MSLRRRTRRVITVGSIALLAAVGLPDAQPAGALAGVPNGATVPLTCPVAQGRYSFSGLTDEDRYVSVWIPAGATLALRASMRSSRVSCAGEPPASASLQVN